MVGSVGVCVTGAGLIVMLPPLPGEAISSAPHPARAAPTAQATIQRTFFIDSLRDTPLIADEYFSFVEIIPMIEDSYDDYEAAHPDTIGGAS